MGPPHKIDKSKYAPDSMRNGPGYVGPQEVVDFILWKEKQV